MWFKVLKPTTPRRTVGASCWRVSTSAPNLAVHLASALAAPKPRLSLQSLKSQLLRMPSLS